MGPAPSAPSVIVEFSKIHSIGSRANGPSVGVDETPHLEVQFGGLPLGNRGTRMACEVAAPSTMGRLKPTAPGPGWRNRRARRAASDPE
jgi:hypothetical protein